MHFAPRVAGRDRREIRLTPLLLCLHGSQVCREMQQLEGTAVPRLEASTSRRASADDGGATLDPSSIAALLKSAEAALAADDAVQCLSATSAAAPTCDGASPRRVLARRLL